MIRSHFDSSFYPQPFWFKAFEGLNLSLLDDIFENSREFCPAIKGVLKGSVDNVCSVAILALIQGEVRGKTTNFYDKT